jgi:hypothetical protein
MESKIFTETYTGRIVLENRVEQLELSGFNVLDAVENVVENKGNRYTITYSTDV